MQLHEKCRQQFAEHDLDGFGLSKGTGINVGRYCRLVILLFVGQIQGAEPGNSFFAPGIDLPEDDGKSLILRSCTGCHTLEGVPAYRKYWGFERWLPMVDNMIKHGSVLNEQEKVIVARYLGKHFGIDGEADKQ